MQIPHAHRVLVAPIAVTSVGGSVPGIQFIQCATVKTISNRNVEQPGIRVPATQGKDFGGGQGNYYLSRTLPKLQILLFGLSMSPGMWL